LARALGADIVIAIDIGSDILGRRFRAASGPEAPASTVHMWMHQLQKNRRHQTGPWRRAG